MNLKHWLEAFALKTLFTGFRYLPLDTASAIGGLMGRSIGPFLSANTIAKNNLAMIFPDKTRAEKQYILRHMWDNLGRVAAELPHLPGKKLFHRINIVGVENIPKNTPCIFFSGHLGNWELTYPIAHIHGVPVTLIYREANNPYVEKMISAIRATQSHNLIAKGPQNAIKLVRALKRKESMAMLVDQKMNDGIEVPFFGRPAMTAPALAEFALRYNLPLIPARILRKGGAHFSAEIYPTLEVERTGNKEKDLLAIMTAVNKMLESWIREYPEQWFWVHRRWPKEAWSKDAP